MWCRVHTTSIGILLCYYSLFGAYLQVTNDISQANARMIRAEFDWLVAWQIKKLSAVLFCFSFLYIRDFKKTKGVVLPWDNDDKLWFICSSVVLRFTMGLCYINQSGERWWRKCCDRRVYTCSCKMILKPGWKLRVKRPGATMRLAM